MRPAAWLVAAGLLVAGVATAQESVETVVYRDTEYVSGKTGFGKKIKGQLVLQEQEVSFRDNDGNKVFGIPIKAVKEVSNSVETDPGSFGRKMALGVFASKREEFLTVKTESPEGAEAVVFKCKKKTSEGMTAKIQFLQKKAAGGS
jgi:hypothetical protein